MATKREYLVTLGLAKPGRGKFSAAAHEALAKAEAEGVVFDEPVKPEPKPRKAAAPKPDKVAKVGPPTVEVVKEASGSLAAPVLPNLPIVRPEKEMYAVSPGRIGQSLIRITYDVCQRCANSVQTCPCAKGPKPPAGAIPVPTYPKV